MITQHAFLYHDPCSDGMMCRAIAEKYFPSKYTFFGLPPGKTLVDNLKKILSDNTYLTITIADISVTKQVVDLLEATRIAYVIIDHHEDTAALMHIPKDGLTYGKIFYDKKHCGCTLTWNTLVDNMLPPRAARLIQIRDLWKWKDPEYQVIDYETDEAIIEYIYSHVELQPEAYKRLLNEEFDDESKCLIGKTLIDVRNKNVTRIMNSQGYVKDKIFFCNSNLYKSEIGSEAVLKYGEQIDFALIWSFDSDNLIHISLRSDGVKCNVHEEARKRFGGGGHKAAAGAAVKLDEFLPLLIQSTQ